MNPEATTRGLRSTPAESRPAAEPLEPRRYVWLFLIILGYIGVYLCRKNFSVAVPLLQERFNATRGEIGLIASYSTIAYALGKFFFGNVVDRIGGRTGFLLSMLAVGFLGIAGGLAPSLAMLSFFYSANRFAAAASWPAMVKLTPSWFGRRQMPFAIALLSLSFVAGGACAALVAGLIAGWTSNNWRAVMALPSLVLFAFLFLNWLFLPRENPKEQSGGGKKKSASGAEFLALLKMRQFWIICALSFVLTLLRETFNTWLVDFIRTEGGEDVSNQVAAFLSTPFDILGALGILGMGWIYGRIRNRARMWLLAGMLAALAVVIWVIPALFHLGLAYVTVAIGLIGFLVYGPYSLLAGTLSVEIRGQKSAGTVSGMVDGVGYIAGILAGAEFGKIVDRAGYARGFELLAVLALASAILCLFLYARDHREFQDAEEAAA